MSGLPSWRGRGVLVTGASSGIGEALARRVAGEGARVVLAARRRDRLEGIASEIRSDGGEAEVLACDLSRAETAVEAGHEAQRLLAPGGVEILFNNAGYGGHRPVLEWPLEDIVRMSAVNYLASVAVTKAVLPAMLERGAGWIVFLASVAGKIPTPLEAPYAATKAAMLAFAEALSLEVEDRGIHVLSVCPGVIDTPFFSPEDLERMPGVARRGMRPAAGLVDCILRGLARGRRELTWPGSIAVAYPLKALAPGLFRWAVKRTTRQ